MFHRGQWLLMAALSVSFLTAAALKFNKLGISQSPRAVTEWKVDPQGSVLDVNVIFYPSDFFISHMKCSKVRLVLSLLRETVWQGWL